MKPPAQFTWAINALNREQEFSPGAVSTPRLVELPDGSQAIAAFLPYWVRLRNDAHKFRSRQPEYRIPPDSTYRESQDTFIRTLHHLVGKWWESDRDSTACVQKFPRIGLEITAFLRSNPLVMLLPSGGPPLVFGPTGSFSVKRFPRGKDKPAARARREAIGLFIELVRHPARERLGMCLRCGRYFFGRLGQKCCPRPRRCGSYRAAIEATKRHWKQERENKLVRAQAECAEWQRRQPRVGWKPWVAERIGITPKWLTRAVNSGQLKPPVQEKGKKP